MTETSDPIGEGRSGGKRAPAGLRSWNIAVGNFFFHYRNALFPLIFVALVIALRPKIMFGSPTLDLILMACGVAVALAGQLVRLTTIGFEYIHRGGKDGQVYANRLVQGGVYSGTRNPMYVGNALIAVGMTMFAGAPMAYILIIPFFLFVYQAIVCAEEEYLRRRFGGEYEEYAARVNRFVPSLRVIRRLFSEMHFDWKRAVRKDLSTIMGLLIGFTFVPVWRTYFLDGFAAAKGAALRAVIIALSASVLYGILMYLKEQRRF